MTKVIDFNQPSTALTVGADLADTSMSLAQRLRVCAVVDNPSCEQAVLDRQAIGDAIKKVEAFFEPLVAMAYKLHHTLCDRRSEILEPLKRVDAMKRSAITDYNARREQEREAEERQRADQQRRADQDRAASEAAALEQAGDHDLAAAVLEESIAAPLPVVVLPSTKTQVAGLKLKRSYQWRYVGNDPARAGRLIPREYMTVDEKKIGAYARSMKGTGSIPGIEFFHVDEPVR